MTYICYDNGAYMNTGIQRSSATPKFADTTTSPAGSVIPGKMQARKRFSKNHGWTPLTLYCSNCCIYEFQRFI